MANNPPYKKKGTTTKLNKTTDQRNSAMERIVSMARSDNDSRAAGYREKSLRIHPHVCAKCGREFSQDNLTELTVHHKDHNHDNNPEDGSNWENLCIYCHDNEHSRYTEFLASERQTLEKEEEPEAATHNPFADLGKLLNK
ncbi:MAG: HNH nuclease family protein [Magnetococcales bacterium]|nr:HNH nuclease family protein [Magnetococcales bacterium]